jgi:hypothetical protein
VGDYFFVLWAVAGQLRHPICVLHWIRRDQRWTPLYASMWGSTVTSSLNRWINIFDMCAHMTSSLFVSINSIQRTELLLFFIRNSVSSFEEYGNHKCHNEISHTCCSQPEPELHFMQCSQYRTCASIILQVLVRCNVVTLSHATGEALDKFWC